MAHKRHKRATETLNTPKTRLKPLEKSPRNQYRLLVAKKLAQQTKNKPQSKHNEEKTRIANVLSVKLEKWDEIRSAVTIMT